jgi:glycosyltransferase involved in cell wall biosynthesis
MNLSVITINYNNALGLAETMRSVLQQQGVTIDYILIDGGSTDESPTIISSQADKLTYWVSEPDQGIYDAMNKGITHATGDYLMFLNSGDLLAETDTLQQCFTQLTQQPAIDVLYGNVVLTGSSRPGQPNSGWQYPDKLTLSFFKNQTLNHQASLFRKSLFDELGLYPGHYQLAADYWLYLTCMLRGKRFSHLNAPLVRYDQSGLSATNSYKRYLAEMQAIWQVLVPPYAQEIVDENLRLRDITDARLVRLAAAGNRILRKLTTK